MLFELGRTVATPGALKTIAEAHQTYAEFLGRHVAGKWDDLDDDDRKANEHAVAHGERVFSAFHTVTGKRVWVITEHDRSVTTVLLPDEY